MFGYYIEVTSSNLKAVPEDYIRKQTLINGERYIAQNSRNTKPEFLIPKVC